MEDISPVGSESPVKYGDYTPDDKTQWQFMRVYELIIGDGDSAKGFAIADMQVSFTVKKNANNAEAQNKASIAITNLSEETLKVLEQDYPVVSLKVGYLKTGLTLLFSGKIVELDTKLQGTDRVTTIEAIPFQDKIAYKYVSSYVAAGQTLGSAIEEIRKSVAGLSKGIYRSDKLNYPLSFGIPIAGTAMQELQRICNANNLEYRIDLDTLYVNDIATTSDSGVNKAPLLSYETGLLTGPYSSTGRIKRGKLDPLRKEGITCTALLNPDVKAGWAVVLQGTDKDGTYKVEEVEFKGDYRGNDWVMTLYLVTTNEFAKMRAEDARKKAKKNKNKKEVVK